MVQLILSQVLAPPRRVETEDATTLTRMVRFSLLSRSDRNRKRQVTALQSHVLPLVTFVEDTHFSTALLKISNDGKAQGSELASHLVGVEAAHCFHLQLHHVLNVRFHFGAPQAVRQAAVDRIFVDRRHASRAKLFVTHLLDAELAFVPVAILGLATRKAVVDRIAKVRDEFSRFLKGFQHAHAIGVFDAHEAFVDFDQTVVEFAFRRRRFRFLQQIQHVRRELRLGGDADETLRLGINFGIVIGQRHVHLLFLVVQRHCEFGHDILRVIAQRRMNRYVAGFVEHGKAQFVVLWWQQLLDKNGMNGIKEGAQKKEAKIASD